MGWDESGVGRRRHTTRAIFSLRRTLALGVLLAIWTTAHAAPRRGLLDYLDLPAAVGVSMTLSAPAIAEDGLAVPVTVQLHHRGQPHPPVRRIELFSCRDLLNPLVGFEIMPDTPAQRFSARIRLSRTGTIFAVAVTSTDTVLAAEKEVKVTLGGCGGCDGAEEATPSTGPPAHQIGVAVQRPARRTPAHAVSALTDATDTWRPSSLVANMSQVEVQGHAPLRATRMRASIKIQGFRARILLDLEYHNPHRESLEGQFKLRLPDGASPYYIAFGDVAGAAAAAEATYLHAVTPPQGSAIGFTAAELRPVQEDRRSNLRAAIMAPRPKARAAYTTVVRRRRDPALLEWEGSGVYGARVFPLLARTSHRVVVGYEVNLQRRDDALELEFPLPTGEDAIVETEVYVHLGPGAAEAVEVSPKPIRMSGDHPLYAFIKPKADAIHMRLPSPAALVMVGADKDRRPYFALRLRPTPEVGVPPRSAGGSSHAIFMVETSHARRGKNFALTVRLIQRTLARSPEIKRFALLCFNIGTRWWKPGYVANTAKNRLWLGDALRGTELEGATDFHRALRAAVQPHWEKEVSSVRPLLLIMASGQSSWGDPRTQALQRVLAESRVEALFGFLHAGEPTARDVYSALHRVRPGATFTLSGAEDLNAAADAHRFRPWRIRGVRGRGASDVIIAGSPAFLYPKQQLTIAGRGEYPAGLVLRLSRAGKRVQVPLGGRQVVPSELAPRIYGEAAVERLEGWGEPFRPVAQAFANRYRVPGRSSSLLMLESAADYQRFGVLADPEETRLLSTKVGSTTRSRFSPEAAAVRRKATLLRQLGVSDNLAHSPCRRGLVRRHALKALPPKEFLLRRTALPLPLIPATGAARVASGPSLHAAVLRSAEQRGRSAGDRAALAVFSTLVAVEPHNVRLLRSTGLYAMAMRQPQDAYYLFSRASEIEASGADRAMAHALLEGDAAALGALMQPLRVRHNRYTPLFMLPAAQRQYLRPVAKYLSFSGLASELQASRHHGDLLIAAQWFVDGSFIETTVSEPNCAAKAQKKTYRADSVCGAQLLGLPRWDYGGFVYVLDSATAGAYHMKLTRAADDSAARMSVLFTVLRNGGKPNETLARSYVEMASSAVELLLPVVHW